MMQMFKYPQGEGASLAALDANLPPFIGPSYPFIYALPLAKQVCYPVFVPANCRRHGECVMAANLPAENAAQAGKPRLRKSLKLWQVVMMGLAYLTP